MSIDSFLNKIIGWIYLTLSPENSIGTTTFTNGSVIVTGTNFVTNNVIKVGGYVKLESDLKNKFAKVFSIDSETELTLEDPYEGSSGAGESVYTNNFFQVIRGTENAPRPNDETYIVVNRPISQQKNARSHVSDPDENGIACITSYYEIVLSIDEINGYGDNLRKLVNNTVRQEITNYFRDNEISFMRHEELLENADLQESFWENWNTITVTFLMVDTEEYETGLIETVEVTGEYIKFGEGG